MDQVLQQLTLPAGTVVAVHGMPFRLPTATTVEGLPANLEIALQPRLAVSAEAGPSAPVHDRIDQ